MSATPVLAILQVRMSSNRLPGKALLRTCGKPLLAHQIERVRRCETISRIVVATSADVSDNQIWDLCLALGVDVHRGSLDDVLDRFAGAALPFAPEWVVRLTGDCPLADPVVIDRVVRTALEGSFDYVSSALNPSFPDGLDAECLRACVLAAAAAEARLPSEREHVTAFVHSRPERFRLGEVRNGTDLSALRWTVDEARDFVFVSQVFERLYPGNPRFSMEDVLQLLDNEPMLATINGGILRNEGYDKSLRRDAAAAAQDRK